MWEQDLGLKIDKKKWEQACAKAQVQTINSRLKLLQYNCLMRTYITPVKLNKIYSNIPDTCFKCNGKGTFIYCMWECDKIKAFWREINNMIWHIVSVRLQLDSGLFIIGIHPDNWKINKDTQVLIDIHAKRLIAIYWKKIERPTITRWLKELSSCIAVETITYILKGKEDQFKKIWSPFLLFIEHGDMNNIVEEQNA